MPLPRPHHRELYFAEAGEELNIYQSSPQTKYEATCGHEGCRWAWFEWDRESCRQMLLTHKFLEHPTQPLPESKPGMSPPGR